MLFKEVKELKDFLGGVQSNLSEKTIMPFVGQAEIKYIIPAIGQAFYKDLDDKLKADPLVLSDDESHVLSHIRRSLAYYTMLDAMPFLNLTIGNLGVQEITSRDANSQPARQWAYYNAENAACQNADAFLDTALYFLESKADQFPAWKSSDHYTISHDLFINSTAELAKYLPIASSRRTFMQLRPYISRATDMHIAPVVDAEFFAALADQVKSGNVSAENKPKLVLIQKALAQLALYEALPEIAIQYSGSGIRVISDHDGIRGRLSASAEQITTLKENALKLGEMHLANLKAVLSPPPPATSDKNQSLNSEDSSTFWT